MDLYTKQGNRYKKIGMEFTGFPANGIWFVKDGSRSLMIHLDDIGKKPLHCLPYLELKDELCKFLIDKVNEKGKSYSLNEIAKWSAEFYAMKYEEQMKG